MQSLRRTASNVAASEPDDPWRTTMNRRKTFAHALTALSAIFFTASIVRAQEPDALSVEWEGKKPCEKLHEDDQIRILRCVFPPGAKHLRHQHPTNFFYLLSGGKVQGQNASGLLPPQDFATDASALSPPVSWHEVTNVGDTTVGFLVVEMKYKK
jgi:quercetin dioxygenase-like cupin family protein